MINSVLYSSKSCEWETPQALFDKLDSEYHFTLDVCADEQNHKCQQYFTIQDDGLAHEWSGRCWMNPPFGRGIKAWVQKAYDEVQRGNAELVCCLVPVRSDTAWWHDFCMHGEIHFIRGRIRFSNSQNNAPFPCCYVIFKRVEEGKR